MVKPRRFDVFLVSLDPTLGAEMRKTRPCIVVSPDEANARLKTILLVPITSALRNYPSRVEVRFQGRDGQAAIDQMRVVDLQRLIRKLGRLTSEECLRLRENLLDYFF